MIKMLLSVIVSLAMAIGGTTAMPAIPETAHTVTVSDFELSYNGEDVALDPEAQITAALGADELDLHFQINMPDGTLMPVSGKLTNDGAQFIISETGKAYSISDDTICELLGISKEDLALGMLDGYADIIRVYKDPEAQKALSEKMLDYLTGLAEGEAETVEVELNGETVEAQKWIIHTDIAGIYGMYDMLIESGNDAISNYLQNMLEMFNKLLNSSEQQIEHYADLANMLEVDAPMDIELVLNVDQSYVSTKVETRVEDLISCIVNVRITPDGMIYAMYLTSEDEANPVEMTITMETEGDPYAPDSMDMDFGMSTSNNVVYSEDSGEEGEDTYSIVTDIDANGSFSWTKDANDLNDFDADLSVQNSCAVSVNGEEVPDNASQSETAISLAYAETAEDDGSITGHVDFAVDVDDESMACSMNMNFSEGAYEDYFAGYETAELTSDTESNAYNALSSDLMCLIGDATAFSGNESVQGLMKLMGAGSDEEYDDGSYEDVTDFYAQELADAMTAFRGTPVNYTAPDGYVTDYVYASDEGDYISVDYLDPATDDMFELTLSAYDEEETHYEYLPIGAAEAVTGPVAELQMHRGAYNAAIIRLPLGDAMFTFPENADFDAVQSILAGFEIG